MNIKNWQTIAMLLIAQLGATKATAEIVPFQFDASVQYSERATRSHILAAHGTIVNTTGLNEGARLAILRSLTGKAGRMFFLEGEGPGYIDARFDYGGASIWLKIEYSPQYIQVKYVDGLNEFVCENNKDGICYDNHRHYYSFLGRLHKTIKRRLESL